MCIGVVGDVIRNADGHRAPPGGVHDGDVDRSVAAGQRSRSRVSASMTRATTSRSTSLRFFYARAGQAIGEPWDGRLANAARLPRGEGYRIRRPQRAYGAGHVVEHLQGAIASVRALYDVHTLAIGDLSASEGGRLGGHHSHQSGLDVDVGFYFHRMPAGYPDTFVAANADLDLAATWALILAFERTSHLDTGVQMIFLDTAIQARLYAYATKRGTPEADLAAILQYPRDADAQVGLVRHWPRHADHLHVRFKPGTQD